MSTIDRLTAAQIVEAYGSNPSVAVGHLADRGLLATREMKASLWSEGFSACYDVSDDPVMQFVPNPYDSRTNP